jgi:hypothetical protein
MIPIQPEEPAPPIISSLRHHNCGGILGTDETGPNNAIVVNDEFWSLPLCLLKAQTV